MEDHTYSLAHSSRQESENQQLACEPLSANQHQVSTPNFTSPPGKIVSSDDSQSQRYELIGPLKCIVDNAQAALVPCQEWRPDSKFSKEDATAILPSLSKDLQSEINENLVVTYLYDNIEVATEGTIINDDKIQTRKVTHTKPSPCSKSPSKSTHCSTDRRTYPKTSTNLPVQKKIEADLSRNLATHKPTKNTPLSTEPKVYGKKSKTTFHQKKMITKSKESISKKKQSSPIIKQEPKPSESNHQTSGTSNHQTSGTSNHQTSGTSNHQTGETSNHQTGETSNHQTGETSKTNNREYANSLDSLDMLSRQTLAYVTDPNRSKAHSKQVITNHQNFLRAIGQSKPYYTQTQQYLRATAPQFDEDSLCRLRELYPPDSYEPPWAADHLDRWRKRTIVPEECEVEEKIVAHSQVNYRTKLACEWFTRN